MNRGSVRLDTWLTRLLWCAAHKQGGELRILGTDLEDVPDKCALTTDYDKITHEFVVRASSGASEMIVINTGEQWAKTQNSTETPQPSRSSQRPQEPVRTAVIDDEAAAAMEMRLMQRAAARKEQREAAEAARAYRES